MRLFTSVIAVLLSLVQQTALAETLAPHIQKQTITIYTGAQRGTYFQIAQDIKRACSIFDVQVIETRGSLDNIGALVAKQPMRTGHRFGLIQSDVLSGVIGNETRTRDVVDTVLPMYNETITILVNRAAGIKSVQDLMGKRVAVGAPGSGVWFTSSAIKTKLRLRWVQIEKNHAESVLSLLVGDIDAMIMVAGHPFTSYVELPFSMKDIVGFIPLTDQRLSSMYTKSTLPLGMYTWQTEVLETMSTQSVLMSARGVPATVKKDLLKCITDNEAELRRWGHPSWGEIRFQQLKKAP